MKRASLCLTIATAVLIAVAAVPATADPINFTNDYGSATVLASGITSNGIQLESYNGIVAPPNHSLGTVYFATGALVSGTILGGGTFSSVGSIFDITGIGNYGQPKGTIFAGSFVGPITWALISHVGQDYVFNLFGDLSGTLYTGRTVTGWTRQTITLINGQYQHDHKGGIGLGGGGLGTPEPEELLMLGTGLSTIVVMFRNKLRRA